MSKSATIIVADAAPEFVTPVRERILRFLGRYGTPLVLAALIIVFTVLEGDKFFSLSNLQNVLVQSAIGLIIALGLTVVLIVGEFDMSIGFVASFAAMLVAQNFQGNGLEQGVVLLLVLAVGAVVGLANGLIVTKLGVNALVATLGVGSLVVGINYVITGGAPIVLAPSGQGLIQIFLGTFLGIKWPIWIMLGVTVVMWLVLNRTTLGLEIQAVGGNRTAAALSGIKVHKVVILAFVFSSVLAAAGGILITANIGSGQVTGGDGYLLASFAAAFLGSAALRDGEFHVIGTVIGVLTIAVVGNGLAIYGVNTSVNYLVQGGLLIAAVGMSTAARRVVVGAARGR